MGKILAIADESVQNSKYDYLEEYFRNEGYNVTFLSLSEELLIKIKKLINDETGNIAEEYDALIIPDDYPKEANEHCNKLTKSFVEGGGLVLPISSCVNVFSLLLN